MGKVSANVTIQLTTSYREFPERMVGEERHLRRFRHVVQGYMLDTFGRWFSSTHKSSPGSNEKTETTVRNPCSPYQNPEPQVFLRSSYPVILTHPDRKNSSGLTPDTGLSLERKIKNKSQTINNLVSFFFCVCKSYTRTSVLTSQGSNLLRLVTSYI